MKKHLAAAVFVAAFAISSAAHAAISASDAKLDGRELTLNIEAPESGWAVIHKVSNGQPGDHIGHAMIREGENKSVQIKLSEPVNQGEQLIVMLHEDKGTKGTFEFGPQSKADGPAMQNGEMVTTKITPQ